MTKYPPISSRLTVEDGSVSPNARQRPTPKAFKPLHNTSPVRGRRVNSSTTQSRVSDAGTEGSLADTYINEAETFVTPVEKHITTMMTEGDITFSQAMQALKPIWKQ